MKNTLLAIALVWLMGFMMACGAINNSIGNSGLSSFGYDELSASDHKMQEMARAVFVWPYYIGKYMSAK